MSDNHSYVKIEKITELKENQLTLLLKLLSISQRTQEKDWRYRAVENIEIRNWISRNNKRSDQKPRP